MIVRVERVGAAVVADDAAVGGVAKAADVGAVVDREQAIAEGVLAVALDRRAAGGDAAREPAAERVVLVVDRAVGAFGSLDPPSSS
jgi:hypothetical protein